MTKDLICEKCRKPLKDGGIDYYCTTPGCEDELSLEHCVAIAMKFEAAHDPREKLIQSQQSRIKELEGGLERIAVARAAMDGGSIAECRRIARTTLGDKA